MIANPLRLDPSRTTPIVRRLLQDLFRRLAALNRDIRKLIVEEDVFGLIESKSGFGIKNAAAYVEMVTNAGRWQFKQNDAKVESFKDWLREQVNAGLLEVDSNRGKPWLEEYVHSAYRQGVVRAFTDAGGPKMVAPSSFVEGTKAQFLRDAFAQPETVSKLKMISTRSFEELKGISAQMSKDMGRVLADGIAHGHNPKQIARVLEEQVGLTKERAKRIARTEVIHAHAEGQIDSFEKLGVKELGVEVEWITAGDGRVCPRCQAMSGTVWKIEDSRGVIPLHPNCRCAWIPANVGESTAKTIPGRRVQKESAQAAPELYDHQPTAVIRWMGKEGMSFQDAKKVFAETGTQVSDATIRAQLLAGRTGTRGAPAALTPEQQASLKAKLAGPVSAPPVTLPPVPKAPPAVVRTPPPVVPSASTPVPVAREFKSVEEAFTHLAEKHSVAIISEFNEVHTIARATGIRKDLEHFNKFDKLKAFSGSQKGQVTVELNNRVVVEDGGSVMGLYHPLASNMQVNGNLKVKLAAPRLGGFSTADDLDLGATFRHEYGHHFWYKGVEAETRQEFIDSTKQFIQSDLGRKGVSQYGATNSSELFAESFSAYTNPKYVRGSLPRVIEEFLDTKLGAKTIKEVAKTGAAEAVVEKKVAAKVGGLIDKSAIPQVTHNPKVDQWFLDMSETERESVREWTRGVSRIRKLEAKNSKAKHIVDWHNALSKAPKEEGAFYRGMGLTPDADNYKLFNTVGSVIDFDASTSTSRSSYWASVFLQEDVKKLEGGALKAGATFLEIRTKSGVDIKRLVTTIRDEMEMVIPKGTKFKVVEVRNNVNLETHLAPEDLSGKVREGKRTVKGVTYIILEEI